jgi:hypothetical protein
LGGLGLFSCCVKGRRKGGGRVVVVVIGGRGRGALNHVVVMVVVVGGQVMHCWQQLCALSCTAVLAIPRAVRVLTRYDHLV